MGQLVCVRSGKWNKTEEGIWTFDGDPSDVDHYIVAANNEDIECLTSLVREELGILAESPIVLTYQLPRSMLEEDLSTSPPNNITTSADVEVMMSVQEWTSEVVICVTYGAMNVAKYQFMCRTPFTIGDATYLADGVTEEDHIAAIYDLIGDDEFHCCGSVLRKIFTEEKLVLVYRFSFEIEKARATFDLPSQTPLGTRMTKESMEFRT
ncbi:hypothetical protein Bca4012_019674 [Brassica carinata]